MSAPVRTEYGLMDSVAVSADRVGDTYVLPASLAQDRFWALDHLDPGNPAWNLAVRFALRGAVDPGILERSIQEIVRRHEVLRTNLTIVNGRVSQVIAPSMPLVLPVEDLRELPEADRVGAMDSFCLAEAHQRFDLTSGPLLRVRLLRVDDKDYVMTVTTHQAIADYWSIGVVAKELGELYTAYCRGLEPRMAPLAIQYGDYAIWQQNRLQDPQVQDELVYWKDQLARLPVAQLPTDHPRSANPTYNSEIVSETASGRTYQLTGRNSQSRRRYVFPDYSGCARARIVSSNGPIKVRRGNTGCRPRQPRGRASGRTVH